MNVSELTRPSQIEFSIISILPLIYGMFNFSNPRLVKQNWPVKRSQELLDSVVKDGVATDLIRFTVY